MATGSRTSSRHYLAAQRFVQHQRNEGIISVDYCPSSEQLADFLTKHTSGPTLKATMSRFMVTS